MIKVVENFYSSNLIGYTGWAVSKQNYNSIYWVRNGLWRGERQERFGKVVLNEN